MLGGDVVDQLLNEDGLAHAGAAEQADLAALCIRADQVNDLDAGLKDLGAGLLLLIRRRFAVDGPAGVDVLGHGPVVDRVAEEVEDAAEAALADGNGDGLAGVHGLCAALEAVGGAHGDAAHHVVADLLRDLRHELFAVQLQLDGV